MQHISLKQRTRPRGFTLLELMISLVILTLLAIFAGQLYISYTNSSRDVKAGNMVFEEARFLMERIVREVRQNAIDYEQYFNQNVVVPNDGGGYKDNYCAYSAYFYDDNGESIGSRNPTLKTYYELSGDVDEAIAVRPIENELYLINIAGDERTIIRLAQKEEIPTIESERVGILKLVGKDFGDDGINGLDSYNNGTNGVGCEPDARENDGKIDTWHCASEFPCDTEAPISNGACAGYTHAINMDETSEDYSFIDISPATIDVVDLKFMIAPEADPWKAYNIDEIQMQPHVTIQLTAQAHPVLVDTSERPTPPSITLTSTISTRNYDEINSDCF